MKRWIWIFAAVAIVAWSLLSWGGYALVSAGGDWLGTNADVLALPPEGQHWLQWALRLIGPFGAIAIGIVWAVGSAAMLVGAWLFTRFAGKARDAWAGSMPR